MGPQTTEEPGRGRMPAGTQPGTLQPAAHTGHPVVSALPAPRPGQPGWRKWLMRLGLLVLLGVGIGLPVWRAQRPKDVTLVQPTVSPIMETIAGSGRVVGVIETVVGAQATGIVEQVFVQEGDRVAAGQVLAVLKHDVARAQAAQAAQAVETARSQLAQVQRGPLPSEVKAAAEQAQQARAQLAQQAATVRQAEQKVAQARAQLQQLQAELDLADRQLQRAVSLHDRGYMSRAEYDQTQTQFRVAKEKVTAAQQAVAAAQADVQVAQAGLAAAQANVKALEARLQTVQTGATPEEIEVARQRVADAEHALRVAREQAEAAMVTAPFAGVIATINAQPGQPVGTQGVVRLVSTALEIRLDVDESNLADLALGQEAIISSSTFPDSTFRGQVVQIGAAVDVTRGTVQVTVKPPQPPDWLRPGQTVNVNIITHRAVPRLLVPATALSRVGDRTVVFVVEDGRALEKVVLTRPPTAQGVPVLAGLTPEDRIIAHAQGIVPGQRVRVIR